MARQHERTLSRKGALQVLYTGVIRDKLASQLLADGDILCLERPLSDYSVMLVQGVEEHIKEIDGRLASISENWSVERMPIMDRNILRLAMYEMLYVDDVPTSVSINEAVELAKEFGGEDDSPRFVNGMLGRIARQMEAENEKADAEVHDA
ncbi:MULTISPECIES: transcription antitermination factor NusB [unclassified Adlercreutzia]|uniref:transcription antitermination factor NusB n=1 Tax=unclassified Adlercreutzia TaxID=2636013 RepID=UPI001F156C50|nr:MULTISPECIES: transcription antitermination factor NusB [unclassified Adlercreutzia]